MRTVWRALPTCAGTCWLHHHVTATDRASSPAALSHPESEATDTLITTECEKRQRALNKTEGNSPLQHPRKRELQEGKVAVGQFLVPRTSGSLAAYVNASETLTALVLMGVDLSQIDQNAEAANYLVKLDLDRDVQPYTIFLHHLGLSTAQLAQVITHSPGIFQESLENVEIRVNYLASKGFSHQQIVAIVSRAKGLLERATHDVDRQLGYLQQEFSLTGKKSR